MSHEILFIDSSISYLLVMVNYISKFGELLEWEGFAPDVDRYAEFFDAGLDLFFAESEATEVV